MPLLGNTVPPFLSLVLTNLFFKFLLKFQVRFAYLVVRLSVGQETVNTGLVALWARLG